VELIVVLTGLKPENEQVSKKEKESKEQIQKYRKTERDGKILHLLSPSKNLWFLKISGFLCSARPSFRLEVK
jgi:hypothetical protein